MNEGVRRPEAASLRDSRLCPRHLFPSRALSKEVANIDTTMT